jgi:hypothetical protein
MAATAMVAVAIRNLVTRRIGPQIPSAVVTLTTAFLVMLGGALWSAVEALHQWRRRRPRRWRLRRRS